MGKRKSWLKTMKNAFKSSSASSSRDSSDKRVEWSSSQRDDEYEDEGYGTMMPEIVSVEHFPSMDGDCEEEEDEEDDDEYANVVEMAAEAAAEAAKRAVHLMRLAKYGRRPSKEEMATVIIQSCFRGYLARKARRALRALVRLQAIVRGYTVRKQTQLTMQCMQSLVRVQARARAARLSLLTSTPNPNNNIQGTIKHCYSNNDLYTISDYSEIDDETTHCDVNSRKLPESMLDREKELAYAFSCQERRQLGWKWLEQRMSTDQELMSSLHDSSHTMKKNIVVDDLSEKTVEIDNDLTKYDQKNHFDQRDDDGGGERMKKKQGIIPSYMVATQSAKAKVREGNYSRFDHGQRRDQNRRHSGYSPDSSCGDRTPPFRGRLGKNES